VDNHPGKGVNFIITLPASERGRENRFKDSWRYGQSARLQ
jgi:hypothetical protein